MWESKEMKRARNVLVLIWKQFLPHRPLKGTQRSLDCFLKTTVLRWCTYDATLKHRKKIWVLLLHSFSIFKIRQKLSCVNTWCVNWCWYTCPLELSVLGHHVLREELSSTSQWGACLFPVEIVLYGLVYILPVDC